jgi:hypothetical protein
VEDHFIVFAQDWQIFSTEIWTAISELRYDAEDNKFAIPQWAHCINDDIHLL